MADASELHGNGTHVDPKQLVDDYRSTQPYPRGFHPDGIDNNNSSIFQPVLADDTDADGLATLAGQGTGMNTTLNTGPRSPNSNPKMPTPGSRLCDLPVDSPQSGATSQ